MENTGSTTNTSLSTGKIIGIIIAITVAVGLMAGGAYMLFYRKAGDADKKKKDAKSGRGKTGTGTTTIIAKAIVKGDEVKINTTPIGEDSYYALVVKYTNKYYDSNYIQITDTEYKWRPTGATVMLKNGDTVGIINTINASYKDTTDYTVVKYTKDLTKYLIINTELLEKV